MKMLLASFMAQEIVSRASDMAWQKKSPLPNTSPVDKAGCSAAVFLIKRRNPTPMTVSPDRLLVLFNVT